MVWLQGRDLAIDLGTTNTRIHLQGRGVVVNAPSVLAVDEHNGAVVAVGAEARQMQGRTPLNVRSVRPLAKGVIVDFDLTQLMLHQFLRQAARRWLHRKPRAVVAVPTGITEVERRAVEEVALAAGAQAVALVDQPLAAGIGAGLPVHEPIGSLIVDVGGGTTEVAVLSLGGLVTSRSLRIAGDGLNASLARHIKTTYGLLVGELSVEELKVTLGTLHHDDDRVGQIVGRDVVSGLSKRVTVASRELRSMLEEPVAHIVDAIRSTLDDTPPELSSDLTDRPIVLVGGAAQLPGLAERIAHEVGLPTFVAENADTAVVEGAAKLPGPWRHGHEDLPYAALMR